MSEEAQPETVVEEEGFEWMLVEIFGHRSHWGRGKEVERFGAKMLRIDVPKVEWSEPTAEAPTPIPIVESWVTHFYGGASIFSNTLTDERTVLLRNAPYSKPARYLAPPEDDDAKQIELEAEVRKSDPDFDELDEQVPV